MVTLREVCYSQVVEVEGRLEGRASRANRSPLDIAYNYRRDVEQMVRGLELAYRLQHLDQEWFE